MSNDVNQLYVEWKYRTDKPKKRGRLTTVGTAIRKLKQLSRHYPHTRFQTDCNLCRKSLRKQALDMWQRELQNAPHRKDQPIMQKKRFVQDWEKVFVTDCYQEHELDA